MKPYVKLAATLVMIGAGIISFERFGLGEIKTNAGAAIHLDGTLLSILVVAPVLLIVAGCIVFMVGRMRRL